MAHLIVEPIRILVNYTSIMKGERRLSQNKLNGYPTFWIMSPYWACQVEYKTNNSIRRAESIAFVPRFIIAVLFNHLVLSTHVPKGEYIVSLYLIDMAMYKVIACLMSVCIPQASIAFNYIVPETLLLLSFQHRLVTYL